MSKAKIIQLKSAGATQAGDAKGGNLFQGVAIESPDCPDWLCDSAREYWGFITAELEQAGLVSKLDQGALSALCTTYARMREAELAVAEHGEYQTFANGVVQLSPYAAAFNRHTVMYLKLAREYGLTLRSRQNIKVDNPNQGELEL